MANIRNTWIWGALMIPWGLVTVLLDALAILLLAPFLGGKRAFFLIAPLWIRLMFRIAGIRMEVRGWETLPEAIRSGRQPVVFMSNHQSNLDPPVLITGIPVPAVYISKKELIWVPIVGLAAWLGGTIFIDRSKRERAIQGLKQAAREVRNGKSVVIFPEGTRTRTGKMGPFKKGGFSLAMDAGVPVIPMATVGGFETLPPGSLRLRPGRYSIHFGEPVDPTAFDNRDTLQQEVHRRISALVDWAQHEA